MIETLTFGSLFAGIGGFDLGLERAGMQCKWQVEIDDYCQRVLTKHWPNVPKFRDVRECGARNLVPVDVVCGGFPCQDVSGAGKRIGIDGARSGLWREFARIIGELRPRYVIVENVSGLLNRGMDRVCGDLAALRYDTEWQIISAASFGAPHLRERVFIIAYPNCDGLETNTHESILRDASIDGRMPGRFSKVDSPSIWSTARPIGARPMGVGNGISSDVDRLRALGNAIVPQVAEFVGRCIMESTDD